MTPKPKPKSTRRKEPVSFYDLTKHLCGSVKGKPDLAIHPKYLKGFGK